MNPPNAARLGLRESKVWSAGRWPVTRSPCLITPPDRGTPSLRAAVFGRVCVRCKLLSPFGTPNLRTQRITDADTASCGRLPRICRAVY